MSCVNINIPEFKALVEASGLNPYILAAKVGVWQEDTNSDAIPSLLELGIEPKVKSDVIDTPVIKEGVSELFEENSELAEIGTQEQYSQYLNTIFPESKVKDIVYHGTDKQFEQFISDYLGTNTKAEDTDRGFAFTTNKDTAKTYGKNIKAVLLNAYNLEKVSPLSEQYEDILKPEFPSLKEQILDLKELIDHRERIISINTVKDLPDSFYVYSEKAEVFVNIVKENSNFYAYVNGKKIDKVSDKQALSLFEKTKQDTTELKKKLNLLTDKNTVFVYENIVDDRNIESITRSNIYFAKPERIHILGGKQDIQGFKEFVNSQIANNNQNFRNIVDDNFADWASEDNESEDPFMC